MTTQSLPTLGGIFEYYGDITVDILRESLQMNNTNQVISDDSEILTVTDSNIDTIISDYRRVYGLQ